MIYYGKKICIIFLILGFCKHEQICFLTDCLENFGHGGNILLGGRLLPVQVIHYDGRAQSLPSKW